MITLQKLLNLAKRHGLDPSEVVIVLRQLCGDGNYQLDFLDGPQLERNIQVLGVTDEFVKLPVAFSVEILMPKEDDDGSDEDIKPGPFDNIIQKHKEYTDIPSYNPRS
jgi:hypothetical protein